jgi:hypothetical protein
MPFKSLAQEGFLHAHPEKLGKKGLAEWDAATKGKHLPEHVKTYDSGGKVDVKDKTMAADWRDGVTGKDRKPKKEIKEMVHTKSHNGKHIVTHRHHHPEHHPDETHVMGSMDELHAHMDDHAGTPNAGEAAPADGGPAPMTASPSPMPEAAPAAGAAPGM